MMLRSSLRAFSTHHQVLRRRSIPSRPPVLRRASAAWRASEYVAGQYLRDLTGNGHDARIGVTGSARVLAPTNGKPGYLRLPGVVGNYASTPDHADLDITGDIEVIVKVALQDWTPSGSPVFVGKYGASGSRGYGLQIVSNRVRVFWSYDGVNVKSLDSTVTPTVDDGDKLWIRATLDVDNGSAGHDALFYTSSDGMTWTQLGTTVTGVGTTSVFNTTASLEVGSVVDGTSSLVTGRIFHAIVKNGIDGTTVFDADFTNLAEGTTSFVEVTGKTVTINSVSGADSNDPAFLPYAGEKYVNLPGIAGNYGSMPDVNLFPSDIAHVHDVGGFVNGTGFDSASETYYADDGHFGHGSVGYTADGLSAAGSISSGTVAADMAAVTAGSTYSGGCYVKPDREQRFRPEAYFDAGTNINGAYVTCPAGVWTYVSHTFTVPTGAAYTRVVVRGETLILGDDVRVSAFCVRTGSDSTFVPSTRVVGDIDLRAKVALDDWTPGSTMVFLAKEPASDPRRAYEFRINSAGGLGIIWYPLGTSASGIGTSSSVAVPTVDGSRLCIRATLDVDNGASGWTSRFWTGPTLAGPWTQLGTDVTGGPPTSINGESNALVEVGSRASGALTPLEGKIYSAEVRDGIDGPVVASFDAQNLEEPYSTLTTPEGHLLTLNRAASGRKLAVVDRSMFLFGTDDYMEVPDHDDLDFDTPDSLTVALVFRRYGLPSATQVLISKSDTTTPGYWMEVRSDGKVYTRILDSSLIQGSGNGVVVLGSGLLTSVAQRRDVTADTISSLINAEVDTSGADPTTASLASANVLRIGRYSLSATGYVDMEFIGAAIFREALSDTDILRVARELVA